MVFLQASSSTRYDEAYFRRLRGDRKMVYDTTGDAYDKKRTPSDKNPESNEVPPSSSVLREASARELLDDGRE